MSVSTTANQQTVLEFVDALQDGRISDLSGLLADSVVGRFPHSAGLFLPVIEGKPALSAHLENASDTFQSLTFTITRLTADAASGRVVAEFDGRGTMQNLPDYQNVYVMVFEFTESGHIREITEYYNAMATGTYFGMIEVTSLLPE